ncbi:MAG: AraC family transcriptional regulator, partial [Marinilabiliales bacterium]
MELSILQIFSLLIVFVSLLLAGFLLAARSKNYLSNLLLAAFLIVSAIDSDSIFLGSYIYPNYPTLGLFLSSLIFFKIPLLYLYLLSVIYANFSLNWKSLLHTIPFIIDILIFVPRFYSQDLQGQIEFFEMDDNTQYRALEVQISYFLIHGQIIAYLIAMFITVNRYRKLLLQNYSNASLINYKWLFSLLIIFSVEFAIASLKNLFLFFGSEETYYYSMFITSLVSMAYIIWLVFKTMIHPEIFRGVDSKLQLVDNFISDKNKEDKSDSVDNFGNATYFNKKTQLINDYMTENEPFLDPSLTVYDLSKQIGMPVKELSLLINHELNQHFFDFVNGFRIRKAMELLSDEKKNKFTVLEILYDVGFNSKS